MLKSIGFANLVRIFSGSRQSILVDLCEIWLGSLELQFYWLLSQYWVPSLLLQVLVSICESRLYDTTCFLLRSFCLFQHIDLVTTSLRAGFQVYLSQPWVLCTQTKAVRYDLLGVESHFWVLCFFLVNCLGGWNQ